MTPTDITALRARAQLSQEDLGKLLGVTQGAVSDWERDRRNPAESHRAMMQVMRARLDDHVRAERWKNAFLLAVSGGVVAFLGALSGNDPEPPPTD